MQCLTLFSFKIRKNINLLSAELAQKMVMVGELSFQIFRIHRTAFISRWTTFYKGFLSFP